MLRIIFRLILLISLVLMSGCKKPAEPPIEIQKIYMKQAAEFCQVIVGCMQEDMRTRLASEPQRRDLVLKRMNQEVCHANQIKSLSQLHLLGSLEADPRGPQTVEYDADLYKSYGNCTAALVKAREQSDCEAVRQTYDTHPDCQRVRPSRQSGSSDSKGEVAPQD